MGVELYPHQRDAVDRLHNGAILWGGVGLGKTITAATYYIEREAPCDVYVITTARKRDDLDWEREFARYGVGKTADATTAGILTVDSWNNIAKYREVENAFFILDEQRLVGSGAWTAAFLKIAKRNRWIMLSATPGDTWLDYIPVFVANGFYRNRTQFKREHVVYNTFTKFPKVDRYIGVGRLVKLRDMVLVDMPYLRQTTRHSQDIHVDYDAALYRKVLKERWNPWSQKPLKGVAELFWAMRKVVNSSPSRVQALQSLMKRHPRLVVFYNYDYELDILRSFASGITTQGDKPWPTPSPADTTSSQQDSTTKPSTSSWSVSAANAISPRNGSEEEAVSTSTTSTKESGSTFQIAEWNGHKHEPIPTSDRWLYLVQYTAGAEGWNCTTTDAMVFWSLTYSYKSWHQAHGRIDRINTPYSDLFYYTLTSNSSIDLAVRKALIDKRNFNERDLKKLENF